MERALFVLTIFALLGLIYAASRVWAEPVPGVSGLSGKTSKSGLEASNGMFEHHVRALIGEVLSIDVFQNEVTIKEESTGNQYTVTAANSESLGDLLPGARVRVHVPTAQISAFAEAPADHAA